MEIGEIAAIIWEEFKTTPPEERAAEKLWRLGFTEKELTILYGEAPILPKSIWVKTMNALRDIENNFPKLRGEAQNERR